MHSRIFHITAREQRISNERIYKMIFLLLPGGNESGKPCVIQNTAKTFYDRLKTKKSVTEPNPSLPGRRTFLLSPGQMEITFCTEPLKEDMLTELKPAPQNPNRIFIASVLCRGNVYNAVGEKRKKLNSMNEKSLVLLLPHRLPVQQADEDTLNSEVISEQYILATIKQMLSTISPNDNWENIFSV
ncbi:MAG: hypothetical protein V8T90_15785 [Victivallales bacterium]